jgi:hypothetical protein
MVRPTLILFGIAGLAIATNAGADALQNQVLAGARATRPDAYAFRRTMTIERTGAARKLVVEQYDPRRPAAERWTLVSVDGRRPTEKELGRSRKVKRGPVSSYGEVAEWFGAPATRIDTAPGYVTYRFSRLPDGTLKFGSHDASPDTQAEAVVNTKGRVPFVERVRLTSTKGFRMMLVASVQSMVVTSRYSQLADGHAVPAEIGSHLTGALMGKSGEIRTAVTFADFEAVR